jgi:hypothetical protein
MREFKDNKMNLDEIYLDYLAIRNMNAVPLRIKLRMLTEFFSVNPNPWRVVGITTKALEAFSQHQYKRVSKMGINRSHLVDRKSRDTEMLTTDFLNAAEWWDFYYKNDKTILATSTENMSNTISNYHIVDESLGLFKHSGFSWRHTKSETEFLMRLHNSI